MARAGAAPSAQGGREGCGAFGAGGVYNIFCILCFRI